MTMGLSMKQSIVSFVFLINVLKFYNISTVNVINQWNLENF